MLPPEMLYEIYLFCDLRTKHNFYYVFKDILSSFDIELHKIIEYNDLLIEKNYQYRRAVEPKLDDKRLSIEVWDRIMIKKYFNTIIRCPCGQIYHMCNYVDMFNRSKHIISDHHISYFNNFIANFRLRKSWRECEELIDELSKLSLLKLIRMLYHNDDFTYRYRRGLSYHSVNDIFDNLVNAFKWERRYLYSDNFSRGTDWTGS